MVVKTTMFVQMVMEMVGRKMEMVQKGRTMVLAITMQGNIICRANEQNILNVFC